VRKAVSHGFVDLTVREWFTIVPLIAAIFAIGFYPMPFLSLSRAPADELIARVSARAHPIQRLRGEQAPPAPGMPAMESKASAR
jgi:NADH:ubiquinone oxidoreductase subunit 4 (subunit M)